MKKKLGYYMAFALAVVLWAACEDDSTEGMTRITYYPELTLEGETMLYLEKDATFSEPGYLAILNGEDVSANVQVITDLNMAKSGIYSILYTVTNADGFASSASRTVIVTDSNDPIEGFYQVDPASYRLSGGNEVAYGASYEVLVINNGDGSYSVDDLFGGWYAQRAGYGTNYAMQGNVAIDGNGIVTLVNSHVAGWGDSLVGLNGVFYEAEKKLEWEATYVSNMKFYVTMFKK